MDLARPLHDLATPCFVGVLVLDIEAGKQLAREPGTVVAGEHKKCGNTTAARARPFERAIQGAETHIDMPYFSARQE